MQKIKSFEIDHTKLDVGMYVSRTDENITTYDIRMVKPNTPPFLGNAGLHTFEHLFATYVRNSEFSDNIVYGHQGFAYGCVDGAFWDDRTKNMLITLNGGCSEARKGRLGMANRDFLHWAFRKELPSWSE